MCGPRSAAPRSARGCPCSAPTAACRPSSSTTSTATRWPRSCGPRTTSSRCPGWSRPRRSARSWPTRAKQAGVEQCVFDRGGYRYHGRVRALAEGAREAGLELLATLDGTYLMARDGGNRQQGGRGRDSDMQERVVEINRVAKVVKGGRRFSFTALVVVGDEKSKVGVGYGKANEVPVAIQKGVERARRNLMEVPMHHSTITHPVTRHPLGLPRAAQAGLGRYRRHRRRRRPRRARAGRDPRRAVQVAGLAEPDQPGQGHHGRAGGPAPARGRGRAARAHRVRGPGPGLQGRPVHHATVEPIEA